ncbi:MAG: hypothetical protein H0W40_11360 [Methylibium sp.]|uniref:hypothetical protein n=1 Tax=Methylibium sp. TaxID=2067992 RepID=UPI0017E00632|nr:hypothetical protein [Methylibium sp.]MBA3597955.1 hypothetical protein [Methylibium sp.]
MIDSLAHIPLYKEPDLCTQLGPMLLNRLQTQRRNALAEHAQLVTDGAEAGLIAEKLAEVDAIEERMRGKRTAGQRQSIYTP